MTDIESISLDEIKKINRPAYDKLVEIYADNLRERNIRRKDLRDDEFEILFQNEYEGALCYDSDPQGRYGDKAFIWVSRIPEDPYFWNGSDWVHEEG